MFEVSMYFFRKYFSLQNIMLILVYYCFHNELLGFMQLDTY